MGANITHQFNLAAPGPERPDYTLISFPAAVLTDTNSEEIELDQALSLAGRFGRDLLGVNIQGVLEIMATEHATQTANHEMAVELRLSTRTGGVLPKRPRNALPRAVAPQHHLRRGHGDGRHDTRPHVL